ncbi:MAG: NfeD family protein [Agathobacter sp.]|uniref:NfeD family protein n=1 Tax=Agathobacter sp. TaxID=2021311 RepID=UPI0025908273|nr:NfeD family protein [Agathobacter sp.]MCR5676529.1 NfeD family protein [Agathobacter sp.]
MMLEITIRMTPILIWLIMLIAFTAVELLTVGLVSIWLAVGALFALIVAAVSGPIWLQIVVFFVVSLITLLATRPLARKYVNRRILPTNADSLVGEVLAVKETVDNRNETGMGVIHGKEWTLRSTKDETVIPEGTLVKVTQIQGVKLIVEKYEEVSSCN